jgi:hypothetical protein
MSARPIITIALVQAGIVVIGFIALGIALKVQGYPQPHLHWNSVSVMLRQQGMMLLVIPVGCVALALLADLQPSRRRYINESVVWVFSLLVATVLLGIFFYAVVFATRP